MKVDTGATKAEQPTLEVLSVNVRELAKELSLEIANFLSPPENKTEGISPTPLLAPLDQLSENLQATGRYLETGLEAFRQLRLRIRN